MIGDSNATATQDSVEIPPQKTPEEMQKEAENNGWLRIWHEFSWWFPWYRMHVQLNIAGACIHIGVNPTLSLLPGVNTLELNGLDNLVEPFDSGDFLPSPEVAQEWVHSSLFDVIVLGALCICALAPRFPPATVVALSTYAGGLIWLGNHGVNELYNAGHKNQGRAFMAGLFAGLVAVFCALLLNWAFISGAGTVYLTYIVSAMVGALVGNLYDLAPFEDFVRSVIIASLTAIIIAAMALEIPEPIGNASYCAFLLVTVTALSVCAGLLDTM